MSKLVKIAETTDVATGTGKVVQAETRKGVRSFAVAVQGNDVLVELD